MKHSKKNLIREIFINKNLIFDQNTVKLNINIFIVSWIWCATEFFNFIEKLNMLLSNELISLSILITC